MKITRFGLVNLGAKACCEISAKRTICRQLLLFMLEHNQSICCWTLTATFGLWGMAAHSTYTLIRKSHTRFLIFLNSLSFRLITLIVWQSQKIEKFSVEEVPCTEKWVDYMMESLKLWKIFLPTTQCMQDIVLLCFLTIRKQCSLVVRMKDENWAGRKLLSIILLNWETCLPFYKRITLDPPSQREMFEFVRMVLNAIKNKKQRFAFEIGVYRLHEVTKYYCL